MENEEHFILYCMTECKSSGVLSVDDWMSQKSQGSQGSQVVGGNCMESELRLGQMTRNSETLDEEGNESKCMGALIVALIRIALPRLQRANKPCHHNTYL